MFAFKLNAGNLYSTVQVRTLASPQSFLEDPFDPIRPTPVPLNTVAFLLLTAMLKKQNPITNTPITNTYHH
jgi:hypothetical protein